MPTVLRAHGFQVRIRTNDHAPAHVHVFKGGGEARIQLRGQKGEPQLVRYWEMSEHDVWRAFKLVVLHQDYLIAEWNRIHENFD